MLTTAVVEHISFAERLFQRHTGILKRHFAWANPSRESFYYCTAVDQNGRACTYANGCEKTVQEHIRENHAGTRAIPRWFGLSRFHGGMANVGPSCAITAAIAALMTMKTKFDPHPVLTRAFRESNFEASKELVRELALSLPATVGMVLQTVAARDGATAALFNANRREDLYCNACGATTEGHLTPQPAIGTYETAPGNPHGTTAAAPSQGFGPSWAPSREGCGHCGADGGATTAVGQFFFDQAAAFTIVASRGAKQTDGMAEIPLEMPLPTAERTTARFHLHAAICATTPHHVAAYVAERENGEIFWHKYDGTRHEKDVPPPNPASIGTVIFARAPPTAVRAATGGEDDDEDPAEAAATAPPPPERNRDASGRFFYGQDPPGTGPEEENGRDGEEDEEAAAGRNEDPTAAPPQIPAPPAPPNTDGEEPDDMSEHGGTDAGTEAATTEPRRDFWHGENADARRVGPRTCRVGPRTCPLCPRAWSSQARRPQQISHLNTIHARETATVDAMKAAGVDRCTLCGDFLTASGNARIAHRKKCGEFETRAAHNRKRARPDPRTPPGDENADGETPATTVTTSPPRRRAPPTEEDEEWTREFPTTIRTLRKQEWGHWAEAVGHTLLGYTAAAAAGRHQRQLALTELVRTRLAKPRAQPRGGDDEAQEEPRGENEETTTTNPTPPATREEREEDEPYTGHAGATRRPNTEEHLPTSGGHTAEERHTRRIPHQPSLGALGKAARTLFQAQLPRARASEVLDQLRALHRRENPADYPRPPQTPFPHGLKPEKVKGVVPRRLGRAAAPGLGGRTRELLVPVVENSALLAETTALIQDILAGNVSPSFAYRLRACVVHPFLKEAGSTKVRPITPESVWLKIASHLALDAVEKPFRDTFRGWRFGVWGDAAEAVAQIRATYASEPADTLVALDAANAYNRVSRAGVLGAAFRQQALRHTFGVVDLSLGEPGALGVYEGGRRVEQFWSTRGVRQGMVLSPLLFANAVAETLRPIMAAHPLAKVTAYLDDLTVVGPRAAVQAFLDEAGPALAATGFDINPAKSHHLSKNTAPEPVTVSGVVVPLAAGVVRILGAGFRGNGAPVDEWVWEKTRQYEACFSALGGEQLPRHARMNLLRASALPRLTFLLRTRSAEELHDSAAWFDDRVLHALSALIGGAPVEGAAALLARPPLVMGGCGLRSRLAISRFAVQSVGRKGAQQAHTHQVDQHNLGALKTLLPEPALEIVKANAAPGATRALADPALRLGDFPSRFSLASGPS
ncbi:hypothetical protein JKF63_07597 [Porcisia hertigi]|uniref:Reverse transcriptase domain-containing protein n=1 Tax=Porcisia hertigi TaxID=2761500 RepID=A0A836YI23_9TRYP|nr:hypothetical protein JKF63_07597 [Porcisia hertigi]